MSSKLEDFLRMIKPIGEMCGVSEKEMEALGRLLMREVAQREPVVELKESLIGRLKNLLIEYDKTLIVRADGLFEINDKPVEPIIKRSGETWVARFDGVDYLWIATARLNINREKLFVKENSKLNNAFKPFSEIEITDEIAKLRPICKKPNGIRETLAMVRKEKAYMVWGASISSEAVPNLQLATVEDLED